MYTLDVEFFSPGSRRCLRHQLYKSGWLYGLEELSSSSSGSLLTQHECWLNYTTLVPSKTRVHLAFFLSGLTSQQGDLRRSGPPSGQDTGGGARSSNRRAPADLGADSLSAMPLKPP
ncbi:hypothetical protein PoB_001566100 [Plakobranchus ocellatus]|uniref:Uncharacterized protein n=1 Tax=Plakobranchus ocellatus TaxID=259542 RepID=A0AAV3Z3J9_9GAST|nr:hypothetical protein PoB_001566100 [Plakobranchus ocellatus]